MFFCIFEKYLLYFLPHWRLGVTLKILQSFRLFCNWIFVAFHLKVGSVHFILTRARSFISARVVCDIFGVFYCLVLWESEILYCLYWLSVLFPLSSFYSTFGKEVGKKGLNHYWGKRRRAQLRKNTWIKTMNSSWERNERDFSDGILLLWL